MNQYHAFFLIHVHQFKFETRFSYELKPGHIVRPYRPGDEVEIVDLLQLVFDGWPKFDLRCSPLDHWKWKYLDNPSHKSVICVASSDEEIIGVNHQLPVQIKVGDEVILSHYGADLAIHPDFRRMGVSNELIEASDSSGKRAGGQFVYCVTSNPILMKSYSKKYRSFPSHILNLVRIKDIDTQLKAMPVEKASWMKFGFQAVKLINNIKNWINGYKSVDSDVRIQRIEGFDSRIDLFWEKVSDHLDFIVERSRNYLNWRYCNHCAGDYVIKCAEDEAGSILGYSVLMVNRYSKDYPVGYIVDLLTLPERLDVAHLLIANAARFFDEQKVNIVLSMVVKNHTYERIFNRFGFLDSRINFNLFYYLLGGSDKIKKLKTTSASRILFSWGNLDVLPSGGVELAYAWR